MDNKIRHATVGQGRSDSTRRQPDLLRVGFQLPQTKAAIAPLAFLLRKPPYHPGYYVEEQDAQQTEESESTEKLDFNP